uniref:DNA/RNA non-specific endonuclease/pyrophosphatase/phosphodiesterase domain-containing protein n=1 Tax=Lygus hesperus TaxID=30085 RepID=A0A146MBD8_LYGHE
MIRFVGILSGLLVISNYMASVEAAEVRFYAVQENLDDSANTSMISSILNLVTMGRQQKVDQMLLGKTTPESKLQAPYQCQTLHKSFKKYKREFNSDQSMADETWHSVTSTAYLKMLTPRGAARVPLGIKADITKDMIGCDWANNPKFKFSTGGETETQMAVMERQATDEKGHLIPSRLAGPAKWYNLAPQAPRVRTAVASSTPGWTEVEASLRKWMAEEGGKVEMLVMPLYRDLKVSRSFKDLPEGSRRPSGFAFCYRLFDKMGVLRAEHVDTLNND